MRTGVRDLVRDHRLLVGVVALGVLLPVVVAGLSGNLTIVHNDGWAYSRIAAQFGQTGEITLVGWNRAALVGQFVPLGPAARSVLVQHLFVAALGAVLLVCVHALTVPRLGRSRAALITALVAVWPGYALLTTSSMADVPMLALSLLALVLGGAALRRDSRLLWYLAMAVSFWAVSVRIQAVAAPVALLLVAVLGARPRARVRATTLVLGFTAFLLATTALTAWHASLPANDPASLQLRQDALITVLEGSVRGWSTLALVAGPLSLAAHPPWRWRRRGWLAAVVVLAAGAAVVQRTRVTGFFLPNYLAPEGAYADVLSPDRVVFPHLAWVLLVGLAIGLGALLAGALSSGLRGGRESVTPLLAFTVVTALGTLAEFATTQTVFDRYLLPLLPGVLLLAAATGRSGALTTRHDARPALFLGAVAILPVLVVSTATALNAWAFDRARWDIGTQVLQAGTPAERIDAGLEWLGWHSPQGVIDRGHGTGWGFQAMFDARPACVTLSPASPAELATDPRAASWRLIDQQSYRTFLVLGHSELFVYETGAPDCDSSLPTG